MDDYRQDRLAHARQKEESYSGVNFESNIFVGLSYEGLNIVRVGKDKTLREFQSLKTKETNDDLFLNFRRRFWPRMKNLIKNEKV